MLQEGLQMQNPSPLYYHVNCISARATAEWQTKHAFRTIGNQKGTEAWTFSHPISLAAEELLRNTCDQNLVAIYVFGTQRFSPSFRGKFPSIFTVLHNLLICSFSCSIFQSETWVETQKHNCLRENLPWLMLLEVTRRCIGKESLEQHGKSALIIWG